MVDITLIFSDDNERYTLYASHMHIMCKNIISKTIKCTLVNQLTKLN
jgi:hypothetical protein